ncbi:MAG: hypothetical protein ACYDAP_07590 [Thermoplasmataceae archaeon]
MTDIFIIDQSKIGAIWNVIFVYGDKRKQLLGFPKYEDINNAIMEIGKTHKVIPLYKKTANDDKNTVYFKDNILKICNSDKISKIEEELNEKGAKFTSDIHRKYHQDPGQDGRPNQNCPFTKQSINYFEALQQESDFFLILTTVSGIAYNKQSLYARHIHLALNEGFEKDFLTNPKVVKKPEKLDKVTWGDPIDGYRSINSDKFDFDWFKEIDNENIQKPSVLEELQLNFASLNRRDTISNVNINVYSRDAYISFSYLPVAIRRFEYVNFPIFEYTPKFYHIRDFTLSNRKLERLNFLEQLLLFRPIHEFVKYVAGKNDDKIALLLNSNMDLFFRMIAKYRSEASQLQMNHLLTFVSDEQRLGFIKTINKDRKRKFAKDTPIEEVIFKVAGDYYKNYLSKEPWTRVSLIPPKVAFYNHDLNFEALILFGTHYQFSQAIKVVADGMELHYHSLKSGGIAFEDKEKEREVVKYYIKFLKSLTNHLSISNVYIADPTFNAWRLLHSDVFSQLNLESLNLGTNSFIVKG